MANKGSIGGGRLGEVIFRDAVGKSVLQRWGSLFPGIGFGGAYKVLQRTYKFGGQPVRIQSPAGILCMFGATHTQSS